MATKTITFSGAKSEICNRVGDPNRDIYEDRAGELFYEGVIAALDDERMGDQDYYGLVKIGSAHPGDNSPLDRIIIFGADSDLDSDGVAKVLEMWWRKDNDSLGSGIRFIPITIDEYRRMSNDSDLHPMSNEKFYYRHNNTIKFVFGIDDLPDTISIRYVKEPKNYADEDSLTDNFSFKFIYAVINYAVDKLKQEISGV